MIHFYQNLIKVNTISGSIKLVGCEGEMLVNWVSGFIDYSIPAKLKARIDLSTVSGDVYSKVIFDNKETDKISWVGKTQTYIEWRRQGY